MQHSQKKPAQNLLLVLIPMSLLCFHMQVKKVRKLWNIQNHLTSEDLKSNGSNPSKSYNLHFLKSTSSPKSLISCPTICPVFVRKLIGSRTWTRVLSRSSCLSAHAAPHTSSQDAICFSFLFSFCSSSSLYSSSLSPIVMEALPAGRFKLLDLLLIQCLQGWVCGKITSFRTEKHLSQFPNQGNVLLGWLVTHRKR